MSSGGARPGSGRPRKGVDLRVGITFSVSKETARMVRQLREDGADVNVQVEDLVRNFYAFYYNEPIDSPLTF